MCEGSASLDELADENIAGDAVHKALVPLSQSLSKAYADANLPEIAGHASGTERL